MLSRTEDTGGWYASFLDFIGVADIHVMILWFAAMVTACVSIIYYAVRWRQPKPWYVLICLVANSICLLFSILILIFGLK